MGRINVRVDEDLLEEVDSHGDVRSEVVRNALKNYLDADESVRQAEVEGENLAELVEEVVDDKIQEDIYPRLGNIYDRLDEEHEDDGEKKTVEVRADLDPEVHGFYESYTRAFETTLSDLVADLLEEKAHELSDEIDEIGTRNPSWTLDSDEPTEAEDV
ncbi:MAG: ribbon-helix-helix domain-containing protein [Halobacteria archaeon]|nr:ribbon-helix-helix domain-containing protein [Halobacteria archaeon]